MCIICIEFNHRQDIIDAKRMVEAAHRESNAISKEHLKAVEERLKEIEKAPDKKGSIELDDEENPSGRA